MTPDEQRLQKALREIAALGHATKGGLDRMELYRTIGQMQGIAEFHSEWPIADGEKVAA